MDDKYIGRTINGYEIIKKIGTSNDGHAIYEAKCQKCGFIWKARINTIKRSHNINCNHSIKIFKNKKIANIFRAMRERCYNIHDKSYRYYGEKGIGISQEWLNDPGEFEEWALSNGYKDHLSIDRIDEKQDYSPNNCRWIPINNNSKWKSTTTNIEINGILDSGRGWSKRLGYGSNYINTKIRKIGLENTKQFIENKLSN